MATEIKVTKDLAKKIDRGAKLAREVKSLEKKTEELNALKKEFRELAGDVDLELKSPKGATVFVEQKEDAIVRVVPEDSIAAVRKLCAEKLPIVFSLHPQKGDEQNFELNVRKQLSPANAVALIDELTGSATPWVKFR